MQLEILKVTDPSFGEFGTIVEGYATEELLKVLDETTEAPEAAVVYVASDANLEGTPAMQDFSVNCYGGMPIQIGYCNGTNTVLNCLEWHKDSEINIPLQDIIFLLASRKDIVDGKLDTGKVKAFLCPAGTAVELYPSALHYAPCSASKNAPFKVVIILPKGTNTDKPELTVKNAEDAMLFACNKWLLAHKDAPEAKAGAYVGLTGENIDIYNLI